MAFPTSPNDGDQYTTALGVTYEYDATGDKWQIVSGEILVEDDGYGVGWDGDTDHAPSQNAIYDYTVSQHNREISPLKSWCEQGTTSGVNNVYMLANGQYVFAKNSKTNSNYATWYYILPSDYVAGSNITFRFSYMHPASSDSIDYQVESRRKTQNSTVSLEETLTGTFTTNATINAFDWNDFTLDGTNFSAGDGLQITVYMEDDNNVNNLICHHCILIITVNTRD